MSLVLEGRVGVLIELRFSAGCDVLIGGSDAAEDVQQVDAEVTPADAQRGNGGGLFEFDDERKLLGKFRRSSSFFVDKGR